MTHHYIIEIIKPKLFFKATYRNGKFRKLEHLRGKIDRSLMNNIGRAIPVDEDDLESYKIEFKNRVKYQKKASNPPSLYRQFLQEWFIFYENFMKIKPNFNKVEGSHLKKVVNYLKSISKDETEALELWRVILQSWHRLDKFYRNSADLKFISSQINKILINVREVNKNNPENTFANAMASDAGKHFKF